MLPFAVVNLDGELLGASVVVAVGDAVLFFEVSDFFAEFFPCDPQGIRTECVLESMRRKRSAAVL